MIDITSRIPECKIRAYDTGEIVISSHLARKMDLREGDNVQIFMCRSDGYPELFIAKCGGEAGLMVKRIRKEDRTLRIHSKRAAKLMLGQDKKGLFRIGEVIHREGKELHTIIYRCNYNGKRKEVYPIQGSDQAAQ